jgi:murein DD-endopeptidase MepM/ murein hydrolase activator NlpD
MLIALTAAVPLGQAAVTGVAGAADPRRPANSAIRVSIAEGGTAENDDGAAALASRRLIVPVTGIARASLRDTFNERRGASPHEAIDIAAPRGTPVVAAGDGRIVKLFNSVPGGHTVYQFDPDQKFAYYYAHLDAYADGLKEGMPVKRGEVLGYVGTSGNATADAPHLHFAIFRLGPERHWWQGTPVNPFAFLNDPER